MELIYNARIHTLNPQQPTVSALLIENGRIIALGEAEQLQAATPPGCEKFNAEENVILPGLIDAHIHLQQYAFSRLWVDCETATRAECLERVARRASITPPGEWILGHGWNQNNWPEGFGNAAELDQVAPHNPVYLTAKSLHAAWANSAALQRANITAATTNPPDGEICRTVDGQPNGILLEGALELISKTIPQPSVEQIAKAIEKAQVDLWQMGLTGVHDFDRHQCFSALQVLNSEKRLRLRVLKSIPVSDLEHAIALGLRSGFGDDFLRIGNIKAFADGALGPRTAAMFQPYEENPSERGMLLLDAEEILEFGRRAVEHGFGLAIHAIGDRANHEVLNAFEQLRLHEKTHNLPARRHRIEHVQVIHPQDRGRLAQLGIVASMQPIHATSDMEMADRYWGPRAELAYAWREQHESGAILAFGSDAPVEPPHPLLGIHAAITRQRQDGSPGAQGWRPKQKLTRGQAVAAYTRGAAFAAGNETQSGLLASGYLADLIILNEDPFACDPQQLLDIKILGTMVGGEWVYKGK